MPPCSCGSQPGHRRPQSQRPPAHLRALRRQSRRPLLGPIRKGAQGIPAQKRARTFRAVIEAMRQNWIRSTIVGTRDHPRDLESHTGYDWQREHAIALWVSRGKTARPFLVKRAHEYASARFEKTKAPAPNARYSKMRLKPSHRRWVHIDGYRNMYRTISTPNFTLQAVRPSSAIWLEA